MKKVIIYTGPFCAHCECAKKLLNKKNVKFVEYDIAQDSSKMKEMLKKSNGARSVPQIFIGEQHIGGNDKLQALEKEGILNSILGL